MSSARTANLLGALADEVSGLIERRMKQHPSQTSSAGAALNLIGNYPGCSNGQLSFWLQLSHTATVRLLDKLEAQAAVERRPAAADRRTVSLHLTKAGRRRVKVMLAARNAALGEIVAALSPAHEQALGKILAELLDRLTTDDIRADHICRLCDDAVCPAAQCPVDRKALALARA